MIDDAVDDMYDGCKDKMAETVNKMYFAKENTGIFAEAWKDATDCTNDNLKNKAEEDKALTEDHMQAICVYTDHKYKFYDLFNNHVLRNRSIYGTNFPFHYLHFWLTSAIQILNTNTKSHTSYRRTKHEFTGEVGQIMRFGLFASSSYNKTLTSFGSRTCFAIKTYYGEVLIPPYEKFKITKKETGPFTTGLVGCEVVYTVESLGVVSNLNCKNGSLSPLNQSSAKNPSLLPSVKSTALHF
uniref:NAD(P)(+)--arginine ADP-ribosyltransferase n=1 Tax=Mastacembelus armatus TaxID=205130 RepID=A0A3Q3N7V0_9TELE